MCDLLKNIMALFQNQKGSFPAEEPEQPPPETPWGRRMTGWIVAEEDRAS